VDRLLKRVRLSLLFFVALAVAQSAVIVADYRSPAGGTETMPDLLYRLVSAIALTLVPAGVLVWRADAWRSARFVLLGAILWATMPGIAGMAWWAIRHSPSQMDRFGTDWSFLAGMAVVMGYFGPVMLAYGLERLQIRHFADLGYISRRLAAGAAVLAFFNLSRWFAPGVTIGTQPLGGGTDPLHLAPSIAGSGLPFELLGYALLACVCVSAIQTYEAQRRLWQCAAVASILLCTASFYELSVGILLPITSPSALAQADPYGAIALACVPAGYFVMLLAFSSPIWSSARDAAGRRRVPPDVIFSWGSNVEPENGDQIPMGTVVAVAAGADHALALDDSGRTAAWGDNSLGQSDVPEGLADVTAIAAGDGFSLALRRDGTLAAWGANDLGQTTVPAGLSGVTAIAAGSGFALALKADGTVVGWGDGALGAALVPPDLSDVVAISAGQCHALALRGNGEVVAWGDNRFGQSSVSARVVHAKAVAAGGDFSLALLANGTIVAWGDNSYGQLDVPPDLTNVTAIAAGAFHGLALRVGGDLIGWGGGGQRKGEASHPWRLVDFKAVAAGDGFSIAIRAA
jgi:hypothetical protein